MNVSIFAHRFVDRIPIFSGFDCVSFWNETADSNCVAVLIKAIYAIHFEVAQYLMDSGVEMNEAFYTGHTYLITTIIPTTYFFFFFDISFEGPINIYRSLLERH